MQVDLMCHAVTQQVTGTINAMNDHRSNNVKGLEQGVIGGWRGDRESKMIQATIQVMGSPTENLPGERKMHSIVINSM